MASATSYMGFQNYDPLGLKKQVGFKNQTMPSLGAFDVFADSGKTKNNLFQNTGLKTNVSTSPNDWMISPQPVTDSPGAGITPELTGPPVPDPTATQPPPVTPQTVTQANTRYDQAQAFDKTGKTAVGMFQAPSAAGGTTTTNTLYDDGSIVTQDGRLIGKYDASTGAFYDLNGDPLGMVTGSTFTSATGTGGGNFIDLTQKNEFDIPKDAYPSSSSSSGLNPELEASLKSLIDTLSPLASQYSSYMSDLASPANFIEATKGPMKQATDLAVRNLANRGVLDSTDTSRMYKNIPATIADAYMQERLAIGDLLKSGAQLPLSALGLGNVSKSESSDPSESYRLALQALGMP